MRRNPDLRSGFIAAGLVLLTVFVYSATVGFDFVSFDDPDYVFENPHVRSGITLTGLKWAFTSGHAANWHPVTWISHMLDCELFGLSAGAHHAVNVVLHALNTLLVFALFAWTSGARWRSALVAALFAVHPLHVESVAWVSERKDVLSTLFGLTSTLLWIGYTRKKRLGLYLAALVVFAFGLGAKPMLVTLPFLWLVIEYWPLERTVSWRTRVLEKLPFLGLVVISAWITVRVQAAGGALQPSELLPFAERWPSAVVAFARYLWMSVYPARLAVLYPHPALPGGTALTGATIVLASATLVVITGLCLVQRRRRYLLGGWMWYLGTLVPVIGLVQVGVQALADRYTYVPLIGVFAAVVWGLGELVSSRGSAVWTRAAATVSVTVLGIFAWMARDQVRVWQNSETLYERALEIAPRVPVLHNNVGIALRREGRWQEAMEHYSIALSIRPDDALAHYNVGVGLQIAGRVDEAASHYEQAIASNPRYIAPMINLSGIEKQRGRLKRAIALCRRALEIDSELADAHNNLANALLKQGSMQEAESHYLQALRIDPDSVQAHLNLATLLRATGRSKAAIAHYQKVLELEPGLEAARQGLQQARTGN